MPSERDSYPGLSKSERGSLTLYGAAARNHTSVVKLLLENKSTEFINQIFESAGETALHVAARFGYLIVTKMLVESGADVNILNIHEHSPLVVAGIANNVKIMLYLLENGALIDIRSPTLELTPLFWVVEHGKSFEAAQLLVDSGANIRSLTKHGFTPLLSAMETLNVNMTRYGSD